MTRSLVALFRQRAPGPRAIHGPLARVNGGQPRHTSAARNDSSAAVRPPDTLVPKLITKQSSRSLTHPRRPGPTLTANVAEPCSGTADPRRTSPCRLGRHTADILGPAGKVQEGPARL